jgi:hypothetical protein
VLHTSGGDLVEHAPVAYQTINGVRHPVASRFVIGRGGQVGFAVGHYHHSRPLVIDPTLSLSFSTYPFFYSTILGNTDTGFGRSIAAFTDSSGNIYAYVIGLTNATDFPTTSNQRTELSDNLILEKRPTSRRIRRLRRTPITFQ